ncbi:transmembrane protein, putative (macronuclear) [Tetrahymena thermophila SB210]|uniref:Transmembrane protein, putative n=1 Tax=Tetrahymena thermophila (strain SB210) TaxID=312017 RepID=I7M3Y5_TETTS|nr:transmembrane protein, putative [Tetrahymena thermophila SB210]EAS04544.1 transmembrane protein, putative [Tetrahymena thermophila SB210]|eukprot:XP_001024789.1 transmembrane protein, putative [Tetrahymena thermophila SB210]
MQIQILLIFTIFISSCLAGNYLDNYFCQNEICNQYWVNCKDQNLTPDQTQYCATRSLFLGCIALIDQNLSPSVKYQKYNDCRKQVTFDNGNQFFYFLNCQVNCGYQQLWVQCSQKLKQIDTCPGTDCPSSEDFQSWNNDYQKCTAEQDTNLCSFVSDDLVTDCSNSVKAKCKILASKSAGSSNKYVQLMQCSSNSMLLIFSLIALLNFLLF